MSEQHLDDAYIDSLLQQVGGIAMPEGMRPGLGVDLGFTHGFSEHIAKGGIKQMAGGRGFP